MARWPSISYEERFWSWVDKDAPNGCWLWRGWLNSKGYGRFGYPQKQIHRVSYELLVGPIPDGLQLDHLCRVRHCVNPEHLEPVTNQENALRSPLVFPSHCVRGHPFNEANTCWDETHRICRVCRDIRKRESRDRLALQGRRQSPVAS